MNEISWENIWNKFFSKHVERTLDGNKIWQKTLIMRKVQICNETNPSNQRVGTPYDNAWETIYSTLRMCANLSQKTHAVHGIELLKVVSASIFIYSIIAHNKIKLAIINEMQVEAELAEP